MRIFIAYPFTTDDTRWIQDLVISRLLKVFDFDVVTGKPAKSGNLASIISKKIIQVHAVIGFVLPRKKHEQGGSYDTHQWVIQELLTAHHSGIPLAIVKHKEVDITEAMFAGIHWIHFDDKSRDELMIQIAEVLSAWTKELKPRPMCLLPRSVVEQVLPNLGAFECTYQYNEDGKELGPYNAKMIPVNEGISVYVNNIPSENASIQVRVQGRGYFWRSGYISVNALRINLEPQN